MFFHREAEKSVEDDDDDQDIEQQQHNQQEQQHETITLTIKSVRDVPLTVTPALDTVGSLKTKTLAALQLPSDRYVRLICAGRLLAPDTARLDAVLLPGTAVVHAVVAPGQAASGPQAALATGQAVSRRLLRGSGLNAGGRAVRDDPNEEEEEEEESDDESSSSSGSDASEVDGDDNGTTGRGDVEMPQSQQQQSQQRRRRRLGLDRLRDTAGFRRSEVAVLRAYFSRSIDRWIRNHPVQAQAAAGSETDLMRRRLLQEEAWMNAQGPTSEFQINLSGNYALGNSTTSAAESFLGRRGSRALGGTNNSSNNSFGSFWWGFCLGFFVGSLMLVWVWMPTVPHQQKLGILTGISLQLALGMLSPPEETDDRGDDSLLMGD